MELFNNLNKLCKENEAFYFSEQEYNERYIIRSYSYRLASFSDFKKTDAKSSRGTAFIFDKKLNKWSLFCRGMNKFFNLGEGIPKKDFLINNKISSVYEKIDGSLIMFGIIEDKIIAKSKSTIKSEHSILAQKLINKNIKLQNYIKANRDKTIICELVSPLLRIVVDYKKTELKYLCEVNNKTGKQEVNLEVDKGVSQAKPFNYNWKEIQEIQENTKDDFEGFVIYTNKGIIKAKTLFYSDRHHVKESVVYNIKNLIPLILDEKLDDIICLFSDEDDEIRLLIDKTNETVIKKANIFITEFIRLNDIFINKYNKNKREFSINNKNNPLFSCFMNSHREEYNNINDFAQEKIKDYILYLCKTKIKTEEFLK